MFNYNYYKRRSYNKIEGGDGVITMYTLEQSEQWDSIVHSFEKYDAYWLSGYVRAFKIHGDGEPLLFHYEKGDTRGINVVMKRDVEKDEYFKGKIDENQYFDLATPYGYGGWIIEGEDFDCLFRDYETWMNQNGIVSEFVRFHPMIKNHEICGSFYDVIQLGKVVHMDLSSPKVIWDNITSKNRNMIRKAIKNDIKIYNGRFPQIYKQFREIYNGTMDKDDAEAYYYFGEDFYDSVLEDLPQNAQVFFAEKDGTVISAAIVLATDGYLNYHLSGSLQEYSSLGSNNLLLYEVSLWGYANGYRTFYLGGGVGSGEDSLFKFKRAFYKGDLNHFYIGKKIYNTEKYDELIGIKKEIENPGYFPKYRG